MTCPACTAYAKNPNSGSYRNSCPECRTRSIALGPAFHEAQQTGVISKRYKSALERAFHGNWRDGHEAVKAFAAKINCKVGENTCAY